MDSLLGVFWDIRKMIVLIVSAFLFRVRSKLESNLISHQEKNDLRSKYGKYLIRARSITESSRDVDDELSALVISLLDKPVSRCVVDKYEVTVIFEDEAAISFWCMHKYFSYGSSFKMVFPGGKLITIEDSVVPALWVRLAMEEIWETASEQNATCDGRSIFRQHKYALQREAVIEQKI